MRDYVVFTVACMLLLVVMIAASGCASPKYIGNQRCQFVSGFTCINPL